jgi:hypothetical protein
MGSRPALVTITVILGLLFVLIVFKAVFSTHSLTTGGTSTTAQTSDTSSPEKIYFEGELTPLPGVPSKTVTDVHYPGVSIYWVKESEGAGNDTCTLYDTDTKQIYANKYLANGETGGNKTGWMYYVNSIINKDKSGKFLDSGCFK